jgi:hypothetical protein
MKRALRVGVIAAGLVLALAGCDPVWGLNVSVRSPNGQPLEKTALILTDCPRQNEHDLGTVTQLTDTNGEAGVGGLGTAYPPCNVTIAKPGYVTQRTSFDQICNGNREDCDRVQTKTITLQPQP